MANRNLPDLRHGFNMAVSEENWQSDTELPDSPGHKDRPDLPEDIKDIENPLATVAPQVSQFVIRVRPDRPVHLRYFQTFGLAEEMMHGRRHQFGLTRSHHLLRMQSIRALFEFINGEKDLQSTGQRIARVEDEVEMLHEERFSFLEGVDKYLCQSVMSEEGYLDRHIEQYQSLNPELDTTTVENRFERLRDHLNTRAREEAPEVYDTLAGLEAEYGRRVTEVIADAALDTPYLVGPHNIDGFDTIAVSELDLDRRFNAAVDAAHALDPDDVDDKTAEGLLADIGAELYDPVQDPEGAHPRELNLPLLDIPQKVDSAETLRNKYDVIMEAPTEMGQIINAAFRFTGNFGGVIYKIETPDKEEPQPNWLVNPLIADEEIPSDGLGIPVESADSYKELWEWVYAGDRLLDSILMKVGRHTEPDIGCPLCGVSVSGSCHPDGCPLESKISTLEAQKLDLVKTIEDCRN